MIIKKSADFHNEYDRTAEKVAKLILNSIKDRESQIIIDLGCGSGVLTIPLAKRLKKSKILAIDNEKTSLNELAKKLRKYGIRNVKIIKSDARNLLEIKDSSVDYVVSHWLLGVILKRNDVINILKECFRILRAGGLMVHSESDPRTENIAKELYKKADTFIMDTKWWNPLSVRKMALKTGFKNITIKHINFKIKLTPKAAINLFFDWERMFPTFVSKGKTSGKAQKFIDKYQHELEKYGMEFPTEYILFARKQFS